MKTKVKLVWTLLLTILLTGCAVQPGKPQVQPAPTDITDGETPAASGALVNTATGLGMASLQDLGPAPELTNTVWLNTDQPLRLANLRGKVVLLEMWTFDCINCQHVLPSLIDWYGKYRAKGLVIIGNHFPEFDYEANLSNLKQAVSRLQIPFPVAQDNDGKTWNAYNNRYWPTLYLIDKQGNIRYEHIGEGSYPETEAAIQALLAAQ
jgi:thiol-disulfide isomerase/thioredoxin